jgi:sugar phosphate isomerase/epimerase
MIDRREFIRFSLGTLGMLAAAGTLYAEESRALGVQLYTARREAERDLASVLEAVRKIGYQEVEPYWNVYTHPAPELRRMIADHGLRVPSGHFDYAGLESKIDYAKELGVQYMICPMLPKDLWTSLDGFKKAAAQFNVVGEKIQKAGMQFGFHNHNYEFRRFGDTTGFDTLMSHADAKLVCLEMDCYWITQAGLDPLKMLEQYGSRIRLLHLKDRKPGFPTSQDLNADAEHFTEVGAGTIAWNKILPAARKNGITHMFVERDSGELSPLESLRVSYANLQKL